MPALLRKHGRSKSDNVAYFGHECITTAQKNLKGSVEIFYFGVCERDTVQTNLKRQM
jgi:hypothetical protein